MKGNIKELTAQEVVICSHMIFENHIFKSILGLVIKSPIFKSGLFMIVHKQQLMTMSMAISIIKLKQSEISKKIDKNVLMCM